MVGQQFVDANDFFPDQTGHRRHLRQVGEGRVTKLAFLCPPRHDGHVNIDQRADVVAGRIAERHDILDEWTEAQPRFDELRRVTLPGAQFGEIVGSLEENQFAGTGHGHGIAGAVPPAVYSFGRLVGLAEIALKERSTAYEQFAIRRDLPFQRRRLRVGLEPVADGFQIVALALVYRHDADLGRAVKVAQGHADGVKQSEHIGGHGGAAGERDLQARQAELVAQRL